MYGSILKRLRENSGLSQEQVASEIGTSTRSIGYYENEQRKLQPAVLAKLAAFFNVTTDYLLGVSSDPHGLAVGNGHFPEKVSPVKILGQIRAGRPLFAEVHQKGEILLSTKMLTPGYDHFVLEVTGDSLAGDGISDRDFVLLRVQNYIDFEGQIASVILDNDEACLKHFLFSSDQNYTILRSSNPKYADIIRPNNSVAINGVLAGFFKKAL